MFGEGAQRHIIGYTGGNTGKKRSNKDQDLEKLIIKENQEDEYGKILLEGMELVKGGSRRTQKKTEPTPMVIDTGGGSDVSSLCGISTIRKSTRGSKGIVQWKEDMISGK